MRATLGLAALLSTIGVSCSGSRPAEPIGVSHERQLITFSFDSLDARPVSSEASRGKLTVVAFVATWDMLSQAQADFLSAMIKTDGDKNVYYVVALDDRNNRELVEAFATTLHLECPIALGDADTVAGRGPFGEVAVPTVVLLDPEGREAWRKIGLAKSDELRQVMASIERANAFGK